KLLCPRSVHCKSPNELSEFDVVHWISQEVSCCSIKDVVARPCFNTRDHRQAASHRFQYWQAESVFERRRNIGVGGRIERKHIGRGRQETHTVIQPQLPECRPVQSWIILSDHEELDRNIDDGQSPEQ